jgi:hypothetical protein
MKTFLIVAALVVGGWAFYVYDPFGWIARIQATQLITN